MGVYKKFERDDIYFTTVSSRPRVSVSYGQEGWSGNTGTSGSLSLYSGIRARTNVRSQDFASSGLSIYPLDLKDTHSIDQVIFVSGSYPSTGSIRFVRCTDSQFTESSTHWSERHARPIRRLYDHYKTIDSIYFTGSYDAYSSLLLADDLGVLSQVSVSGNYFYPGPYWVFSGALEGSTAIYPSSSFTAEAWVKLLPTSNDPALPFSQFPNIFSQKDTWDLGVDSNGALYFDIKSTSTAAFTDDSTNVLTPGVWHHVAVVVTTGSYATFYIDGISGGAHAIPNTIPFPTGSAQEALIVGGYERQSLVTFPGQHGFNLNGFVMESRIWGRALSGSEVQSIASGTYHFSASSDLLHYARYNDGPLSTAHGFTAGSGAFDYSSKHKHGYIVPWSAQHTNHWQPSDHPTFLHDLAISGTMNESRVVNVPCLFFGKQISPGSVVITDGSYNRRNVIRVLNDDGRGSLYVSGSMTREISGEDYTGASRRKVGNVFYSEGLIAITDPALFDMFDSSSYWWYPTNARISGAFEDLFGLEFSGESKMHTKTFNCRMDSGHYNASNNPTYSQLDEDASETNGDNRVVVRDVDQPTYITSIGLYNEDRQLIAVAKLAQPIRKREKDSLNIRIKFDL